MWDINDTIALINRTQMVLAAAITVCVLIDICSVGVYKIAKRIAKKSTGKKIVERVAILKLPGPALVVVEAILFLAFLCMNIGSPVLRNACLQSAKDSVYMEGEDVRVYPVSMGRACRVNNHGTLEPMTLSYLMNHTGTIDLVPYTYYFDMSDLGDGRIGICTHIPAIFTPKCIYSDNLEEPALWTYILKPGDTVKTIPDGSTDMPCVVRHQPKAYYIEPLTRQAIPINSDAPSILQDCLPYPTHELYISAAEVPDWFQSADQSATSD